jgi:hypothetical protein
MKLHFDSEEVKEKRPITSGEVNELYMAAQGISGIVKVMSLYSMNYLRHGEDDQPQDIFCSVFNVLELLIEPVTDYLSEYPYPANIAPEKESEVTA